MKKIIVTLMATCVLLSQVALAAAAAPAKYTAKKTPDKPTIDGKFDEKMWEKDFVEKTFKGPDETTDIPFKFKYVWDDENLYVGVKVVDKELFFNKDRIYGEEDPSANPLWSYEMDSVQMYFSPTGNDATFVGEDVQFVFTYQDDGKPTLHIGAGPSDQALNFAAAKYDSVKSACTNQSYGYDMEIAIPLNAVSIAKPYKEFSVGLGYGDYYDVKKDASGNITKTDGQWDYSLIYYSHGDAGWTSFENSDKLSFSDVPEYEKAPQPTTTTNAPTESTTANASTDATTLSSTTNQNVPTGDNTAFFGAAALLALGSAAAIAASKKKAK